MRMRHVEAMRLGGCAGVMRSSETGVARGDGDLVKQCGVSAHENCDDFELKLFEWNT